jgi:hypothetical protein
MRTGVKAMSEFMLTPKQAKILSLNKRKRGRLLNQFVQLPYPEILKVAAPSTVQS